MQRVPSAGKQASGAKRGKTSNRSEARKKVKPITSAEKVFKL